MVDFFFSFGLVQNVDSLMSIHVRIYMLVTMKSCTWETLDEEMPRHLQPEPVDTSGYLET